MTLSPFHEMYRLLQRDTLLPAEAFESVPEPSLEMRRCLGTIHHQKEQAEEIAKHFFHKMTTSLVDFETNGTLDSEIKFFARLKYVTPLLCTLSMEGTSEQKLILFYSDLIPGRTQKDAMHQLRLENQLTEDDSQLVCEDGGTGDNCKYVYNSNNKIDYTITSNVETYKTKNIFRIDME